MKAFIIAGTSSGIGKTTITIALMKIFRDRGYKVAPFKVGPDFIDTKFHKFVTKNNSYNLDTWMLDKNSIKYLFNKNSKDHDLAIIEGVMGLYDGAGINDIGSTAYLAKILDVPVILVVDAKAVSRSIAGVINGFCSFDRKVKIKGIICNRVSSESHYLLVKNIIEKYTKVKCCGYIKEDEKFNLKSRHLGLIPVEELDDLGKKVDYISDEVKKTLDINVIDNIASFFKIKSIKKKFKKLEYNIKIGIALDQAFNFYYQANLDLLEELGIELIPFSPINDKRLPKNIDALYIGGGFPEEFAEKLSRNKGFISYLKEEIEAGLPVYAECGGLMYLTQAIIDKNNKEHKMVGFFNAKTIMKEKLQRFGYVELEYEGIKIKAHEFHHSVLDINDKMDFIYKYRVKKNRKNKEWQCGLFKKNVLAGYAHVHFYSNFDFFYKILELFKNK